MKISQKRSIFQIGMLIALAGIYMTILFLIIPEFFPHKTTTILKNSAIYDEPIYLIFNWEVDAQVQVGKLIILDIEIHGLPYNKNMTEPNIELFFEEKYLNYWSEDKQDMNEIISIPSFKLEPDWENNRFVSNQVELRFIIPDNIPIKYYDYNLKPSEYEIPNIIHPASYDLAERIDSNKKIIIITLLTMLITFIVVITELKRNIFNV